MNSGFGLGLDGPLFLLSYVFFFKTNMLGVLHCAIKKSISQCEFDDQCMTGCHTKWQRNKCRVTFLQEIKGLLISEPNNAASSAKTSHGERLSFANWFLRIVRAISTPAIVAEAE